MLPHTHHTCVRNTCVGSSFNIWSKKAKDQYIKTIVSDEAPNINADDNETIRLENEIKKAALKELKRQLAETCDDIRKLAPLVEEGIYTVFATLGQHFVDFLVFRFQESKIVYR